MLLNVNIIGILDVFRELLICLVVSVIEGTTIKAHHSGEAVHVVDCSGSGDLSTETVTTNGGKGQLVLIHEANDVI